MGQSTDKKGSEFSLQVPSSGGAICFVWLQDPYKCIHVGWVLEKRHMVKWLVFACESDITVAIEKPNSLCISTSLSTKPPTVNCLESSPAPGREVIRVIEDFGRSFSGALLEILTKLEAVYQWSDNGGRGECMDSTWPLFNMTTVLVLWTPCLAPPNSSLLVLFWFLVFVSFSFWLVCLFAFGQCSILWWGQCQWVFVQKLKTKKKM